MMLLGPERTATPVLLLPTLQPHESPPDQLELLVAWENLNWMLVVLLNVPAHSHCNLWSLHVILRAFGCQTGNGPVLPVTVIHLGATALSDAAGFMNEPFALVNLVNSARFDHPSPSGSAAAEALPPVKPW